MTLFIYNSRVGYANRDAELLVFDTIEDETITRDTEIVKHPIESGAYVADHIIDRGTTISVSGFISNTPIFNRSGDFETANIAIPTLDAIPEARAISILSGVEVVNGIPSRGQQTIAWQQAKPDATDWVAFAIDTLRAWQGRSQFVNVIDSEIEFQEFKIVRYSWTPVGSIKAKTKDGHSTTKGCGGATFTIDLESVAITASATVAAPVPKEPRGLGTKDKGAVTPEAPGDAIDAALKQKPTGLNPPAPGGGNLGLGDSTVVWDDNGVPSLASWAVPVGGGTNAL